jgi:hypothetical protein
MMAALSLEHFKGDRPPHCKKKHLLGRGIVRRPSDKYVPDIGAPVRQWGAIPGGGGHGDGGFR